MVVKKIRVKDYKKIRYKTLELPSLEATQLQDKQEDGITKYRNQCLHKHHGRTGKGGGVWVTKQVKTHDTG